jgi:cell shape-determining protein MreC
MSEFVMRALPCCLLFIASIFVVTLGSSFVSTQAATLDALSKQEQHASSTQQQLQKQKGQLETQLATQNRELQKKKKQFEQLQQLLKQLETNHGDTATTTGQHLPDRH